MKYKQAFIGLFFALSIALLYQGKQSSSISYNEVVASLKNSLRKAEVGSNQEKEILDLLRTVRDKNSRTSTENPGDFLRALAEIKTGLDGKSYSKNYKIRELQKAKMFKTDNQLRTKALPWVSRGPNNVSGRGRGIAVDPSDASGNTWFVATVGGGVWKTTNAGESWILVTPDLPTMSVSCIAIAPSNPDIIYIGTGMGYGRVVDLEGSGVWKSTDHGDTWSQLPNEFYDAINRIVIDPTDENVVILCSNNSYTSTGPNGGDRKSGIFRTIDGGQTWSQVFDSDAAFGSGTDNRVQQIIVTPGNFDVLYASVNEVGVIKSVDGGVSWTVSADNFALPQDIGFGEATYSGVSTRIELAIAASNVDKLYASVERPQGSAALFMSENAGDSWTEILPEGDEINWHNAFGTSGANGAYTSGWFNNTIVVHPYNEDVVFVGGVNLYRIDVNTNNGTHITQFLTFWFEPNDFNLQWVHGDNHLLTIIPDGNNSSFRIVCPNDGGVAYSSDNGISWVQKTGIISTQFYGVDKKPGQNIYIGGLQDNGTYRSGPNISDPWDHVTGGDGFETVWNGNDPMQVLSSSQRGFIHKSYDGGNNFESLPQARFNTGPFITKIANSRTDPDLTFVVTRNGLARSDDFGETWTETTINPWIGYRSFSSVKISDANPQIIWAASKIDSDLYGSFGGIHVSVDGGNSFSKISQNLPNTVLEASGIATDPADSETAYLLFSAPGAPKILKTTDLGETWEDLSGFETTAKFSPTGFPDVAVFSLVVMPYNTDVIWAGTEIGLFISNDGGLTWAIADNGFPPVSVFDMKLRDGEAVLATYGRGIWTSEIDELINFQQSQVTLSPRILSFSFLPTGNIHLEVNLRSAYDSSHIVLNEKIYAKIFNNLEGADTLITITVDNDATFTTQVISYEDGEIYSSSIKSVEAFVLIPQDNYINLVTEAQDGRDFQGNLFTATQENGFSSFAFHSPHPYPSASELIFQLSIPIVIQEEYPFMEYKDVLLIETGNVNDWQDPNFYDYAVVEGTNNGKDWIALAPGYDSRKNLAWSGAFQNGENGSENLYVNQRINLLNTFSPGETIFIRFRLYSDAAVIGWGWAVDNIVIQQELITGIDDVQIIPISVYPNPVGNTLFIKHANNIKTLKIMDLNGRVLMGKTMDRAYDQVDVSQLNGGIYLAQFIFIDGKHESVRFVKK